MGQGRVGRCKAAEVEGTAKVKVCAAAVRRCFGMGERARALQMRWQWRWKGGA